MTATEKALGILRARGPMQAMDFAAAMWPDSPGWLVSKQIGAGNRAATGLGMHRAASGLLGKLRKQGLARAIYPEGGYNTRWVAEVLP